jgi:feruloyl-CoA synthase
MNDLSLPPFMKLNRPEAAVNVEALDDGGCILTCPRPMPPYPDSLVEHLIDNARAVPDRTFFAEREGSLSGNTAGDWVHMSYAQCLERADNIAQWLLDHEFGPDTPVMILSENSLAQAALMFAAMSVSAPLVQVSPAYSLLSTDFDKLKYIHELTEPAVIFVEDGSRFASALAALPLEDTPVVCVRDHVPGSVDFAHMLATAKTAAVDEARAKITLDTVAKILFTSGSTGMPKGVINTHRMMCVVQSMLEDIRDQGKEDQFPVVLDWLPWHHTFGGNATFNSVLRNAGTLYIDGGRPIPGMFDQTIANLREVNPTFFSCVPGAYTMLSEALEQDTDLRSFFFSRLEGMSYGGAALPQALYERMQKLAIAETGQRINISTGYGATETGALNTAVYWETGRMGMLGLPMAEVQLKLIPLGQTESGEKFELRVKGPQITPGYYKRPDLDADAFDEDGWFRTGDAVTWVDENDPLQSLAFAGRVTEDFKLTSGTWVHTGSLRVEVLAALNPLAMDALVCGHSRDYVALALWPNPTALKQIAPDAEGAALATDPRIVAALKEKLDAWNQANPGNSRRIKRALFLLTPPSIDAGEITDKRYINQRVALDIRGDEVERLYADEADAGVVEG